VPRNTALPKVERSPAMERCCRYSSLGSIDEHFRLARKWRSQVAGACLPRNM